MQSPRRSRKEREQSTPRLKTRFLRGAFIFPAVLRVTCSPFRLVRAFRAAACPARDDADSVVRKAARAFAKRGRKRRAGKCTDYWRGSSMMERILALLEQVTDESVLENIYWYIERIIVRHSPKD